MFRLIKVKSPPLVYGRQPISSRAIVLLAKYTQAFVHPVVMFFMAYKKQTNKQDNASQQFYSLSTLFWNKRKPSSPISISVNNMIDIKHLPSRVSADMSVNVFAKV